MKGHKAARSEKLPRRMQRLCLMIIIILCLFISVPNFSSINDNSPGGGVADRLHYTANVGSSPFLPRRRKKDNIESRNIVKLRQG